MYQAQPSVEAEVQREEDGLPWRTDLLDCLLQVARLEGLATSKAAVASGLPMEGDALTPDLFVRAANRAGLASLLVARELSRISEQVLPAVVLFKDNSGGVLTDINPGLGYAVFMSPRDDSSHQVSLDELEKIYSGHLFYTRPMQQFDARSPKIYRGEGDHWFWGVLKTSWPIYRDVLIASILVNFFVLAQPLFVMNVYDRVVPNNAVETLWALAIGVSFVYIFDFVLRHLRSHFVELAAKRSDVILSSQLFERVMDLQMRSRPVSVGAFANRLHEFDTVRNFITSSTILTLIDLPFLVLFLVFIGYIGSWLVLVPLTVIPISIFFGIWTQKCLRPAIENVMRGSSKRNATLIEALVGIETIKSLGAESRVQRSWEQSVGYVSQWSLNTRITSTKAIQIVSYLQQMAMVCLVVGGVYLIGAHELTMGGLIACVILNGRALAPLGQVAGIITNYDYAEAALRSLNELMQLPVERPTGKRFLHRPDVDGQIEFRNVSFSYPDQPRPALDQLNLFIRAGEKLAIIGRNGSGKSTLGKLLLNLYQADQGAVLIDGFDVKQLDPADIRENIGYVSQQVTLFYGSIRENIAFGSGVKEDSEIVSAAGKAGLLDLINQQPRGLEMPVGERGDTLSGGQKQAVALARVFLRDPAIFLLDEPTASMDQVSEDHVCRQLKEKFDDKTVILITHKASMLNLVDRLVILDKGRVVADGPKEQVLAKIKNGAVRGVR